MNILAYISRWLGQSRKLTLTQGRRQKAEGKNSFCLRPSAVCLAIVLVAVLAGDALACPMCKAALGSQDRLHGDWVGGFFWSILFMLSMPFLIFSSLSAYMYVLVRRARREAAERKAAALGVESLVDGPLELSEVGPPEPASVYHA